MDGGEIWERALKSIGDTDTIDARGVNVSIPLLADLLHVVTHDEHERPVVKSAWFDEATFEENALFEGTTFTGPARFNGATFNAAAVFTGATFTGPAHFNGATFTGAALFTGATFNAAADFNDAIFTADAQFNEAAFIGDAHFNEATFAGVAQFGKATITGAAQFNKATFIKDAWFAEVTFTRDGEFFRAAFTGAALFNVATFTREARFIRATFTRDAVFDGTTFIGDAHFNEATFSGNAWFADAIILGVATFAGGSFNRETQIGPLFAKRGLTLDDVHFQQPVLIEASTITLRCVRTRFHRGVQLRLRWARIALDDCDFSAPSIIAGVPPFRSQRLVEREQRAAKVWPRLMGAEVSARPSLVTLRRANVAGLGLGNLSVANCRFDGAHNLANLRLESDVIFATAPRDFGSGRRTAGGRQVIAEERTWRAEQSRSKLDRRTTAWLAPWEIDWMGPWRPTWTEPTWPKAISDQAPEALDPGRIAGLYRALRKGREEAKDEPGAADFYFGEMEMRRHAKGAGNKTNGWLRRASRGRVERALVTAYWLVSGYGLRAWRALAWLAVATFGLALAFHLIGFTEATKPDSYWTSVLYAFRATLSLADGEFKLTEWGKLLQAVLRLIGPVLLGLALLALRGRVKR